MAAADSLSGLLPPLDTIVQSWLAEDVPSMDYGGAVVGDKPQVADLLMKEEGVVAGVPFVNAVFEHLGCRVEWLVSEGAHIVPAPRVVVARVHGPARKLLLGERVALNTLARASGIATRSRRLALKKQEAGWHGAVAGTRKTTPGFRLVEKYAMLVGGADAHRYDLSSMVMLKDNHVWSHGSIREAVHRARAVAGFALKIEVECGSLDNALEALQAGADIVMLDNFKPDDFKAAAAAVKAQHPHALVEGSGGITEDTIQSYMSPREEKKEENNENDKK